MKQLSTPVLIIAFKRPRITKILFEQIRKVRPKELFISIDGPRNESEREKVAEVRRIFSKIDWPCKVHKRFFDKNQGLIGGTLGALHWFFDEVEEGIVFEDDCNPTPDFFIFCEEMLERYRDDKRIMHITGCNFQRGWQRERYSYYFSTYTYMLGFASWKRAWKKYDFAMKDYPRLKKKGFFRKRFPEKHGRNYLLHILDRAYVDPRGIDTKWLYSVIADKGLSIVPNKNLVENMGVGGVATNTKTIDSHLYHKTAKLNFPLKHPPRVIRDKKSDERYAKWLFWNRLKKFIFVKTGLARLFFS